MIFSSSLYFVFGPGLGSDDRLFLDDLYVEQIPPTLAGLFDGGVDLGFRFQVVFVEFFGYFLQFLQDVFDPVLSAAPIPPLLGVAVNPKKPEAFLGRVPLVNSVGGERALFAALLDEDGLSPVDVAGLKVFVKGLRFLAVFSA